VRRGGKGLKGKEKEKNQRDTWSTEKGKNKPDWRKPEQEIDA